jgi:hypothetical protein
MPSKIPVLEIFGPTIQGEGRVIGRKTMFLKLVFLKALFILLWTIDNIT